MWIMLGKWKNKLVGDKCKWVRGAEHIWEYIYSKIFKKWISVQNLEVTKNKYIEHNAIISKKKWHSLWKGRRRHYVYIYV